MNAGRPDPRITWIVDRMHGRLAEPMSVGELAGLVNLSRSQFRTLFVAQIGVPPLAYLQRLRLRRARVLIERTFLSVKDVMALVGYNDPSHFGRDFRREHGAAPSELRDQDAVTPMPPSPSADQPTYRRIRRLPARDPGSCVA